MEPRATKITIRDVAREAGVSRGTVSRVLNGGERVSPASQAAVEAAIRRTNYRSNPHARSLATGRANAIGVMLTAPPQHVFTDPTFGVLLRSISDALVATDLALVVLFASDEPERERCLRLLDDGQVDAVIHIAPRADDPMRRELARSAVPVVVFGETGPGETTVWSVVSDDAAGARAAAAHLLEGGARRIATITGAMDTWSGKARLRGFREGLGPHLDATLIEPGDFSRRSAVQGMAALLKAHPDLDAVFVASDLMAHAAAEVLREHGRRIPEDVALVGFDDLDLEGDSASACSLSTVRPAMGRIGAALVALAQEAIGGGEPMSVVLPTTLVVRASSARDDADPLTVSQVS